MITEAKYHIYVNSSCVRCNLNEDEFQKEMTYIKNFLELTNLSSDAKIDYVRCEPPMQTMYEGSY